MFHLFQNNSCNSYDSGADNACRHGHFGTRSLSSP